MAISGVNPKCYILALFVRDDGARFLLGDDPFEFKDNQLHFQQNTMANDVVEVQGNDGYLLAGQVRRPGTQSFDGYVCNGTNSKAEVEAKRREFLQFFRRSHFYKVIYVFPNGTAIQRKQGFLVDDPTVQELYQQYPEYHVALNFEDVNYYTYEEDDQGQEIYAKEAIVPLAGGGATGGLIWDEYGVVWDGQWSDLVSVSGSEIQIDNEAGARAPIQDLELQGDTYQQTYSGKNLFNINGTQAPNTRCTATINGEEITITSTVNSTGFYSIIIPNSDDLLGKTATLSIESVATNTTAMLYVNQSVIASPTIVGNSIGSVRAIPSGSSVTKEFTFPSSYASGKDCFSITLYASNNGQSTVVGDYTAYSKIQLELGSSATSFEPYTAGPAPNPDYPQAVQTVTGEQTVAISNGTESQEYEINLGKNLWGGDAIRQGTWNSSTSTSRVTVFIQCSIGDIFSFTNPDTTNYQVDLGIVDSTNQGSNTRFTETGWIHDSTYTYISQYNGYLFAQVGTINGGAITVEQAKQIEFQLEKGSATSYAPYFAPIELCKIGDYQDYIYKSGDDWYLHKDIGYMSIDVSNLSSFNSHSGSHVTVNYNSSMLKRLSSATEISVKSANYVGASNQQTWGGSVLNSVSQGHNGNYLQFALPNSAGTSYAEVYSYFENHPTSVYYALATPTETQITDATLVGQLEALGAMKLFIGENNVLVGATGTNLPAMLAFDYYTKFAAIGAEWEEGGTKGATIVDVDAIDNTYPVWELTGPAANPTLSVLTTNTALTYNGTITASQKLVIDMFNKTATLNGTSVIGNISGDYVYMAPGTNRVTYTAGNTDAPDSTIYWQEVVG